MSRCVWIIVSCFALSKIVTASVLHTFDRQLLKDASLSSIISEIESALNRTSSTPPPENKQVTENNETNGNLIELQAKELAPNSNIDENSIKKSKNDEILSRIELALSKSKENNYKPPEVKAPADMIPIFKPSENSTKDFGNQSCSSERQPSKSTTERQPSKSTSERQPSKSTSEKNYQNSTKDGNQNNFVITGAVLRPLVNTGSNPNSPSIGPIDNNGVTNLAPTAKSVFDARRASPTINLGALAEAANQNVPCAKAPTNCDCSKKDATVVFYKPETLSLEQAYGDFMKKLTMTVLVPLYTSKVAV